MVLWEEAARDIQWSGWNIYTYGSNMMAASSSIIAHGYQLESSRLQPSEQQCLLLLLALMQCVWTRKCLGWIVIRRHDRDIMVPKNLSIISEHGIKLESWHFWWTHWSCWQIYALTCVSAQPMSDGLSAISTLCCACDCSELWSVRNRNHAWKQWNTRRMELGLRCIVAYVAGHVMTWSQGGR